MKINIINSRYILCTHFIKFSKKNSIVLQDFHYIVKQNLKFVLKGENIYAFETIHISHFNAIFNDIFNFIC